jgi:hypothetical protein
VKLRLPQLAPISTRDASDVETDAGEAKGQARPPYLAGTVLATGAGILIVSLANTLARATEWTSPTLAWLGILVFALPIFYRLTSREASAGERLAMVCLLGFGLYAVKVLRDAPMFTFSDELVHGYNEDQIGIHHHLFHANPILKVTPYYPGLEGATSALTSITGVSTYTGGIILVGVARLLLMLCLFTLFRRVSGSSRTAGIGTAIYTANFNFMFWGAQFSYESLSLPLLLMVMMCLAEREQERRVAIRDWGMPIVLGIAAIVVTHHLTSYAMVVILTVLSLLFWYLRKTWKAPNPWPFAVFGGALALLWLFVVASSTVGYLTPVLSDAFNAIIHTVRGEEAPRGLFQGRTAVAGETPVLARLLGLSGVFLLTIGVPFGLLYVWRRYRRQPFPLIFGLGALGFFGSLALRLTPPAWETGNRASEFLFIGLAFVLAVSCRLALHRWGDSTRVKALLAAALGVVVLGGAISGWPWDLQLARPLQVTARDGGEIVSPPLATARWAAADLPEGRFAATTADANLLLVPGGKKLLTGPYPDVEDVLSNPKLEPSQLELLRENDLRYVVADRRLSSTDVMRGYYFATSGRSAGGPLRSKKLITKYARLPRAARIYTNGSISIYDLEAKR